MKVHHDETRMQIKPLPAMIRPTFLLIVLLSAFLLSNVQSAPCTGDDTLQSNDLIKEWDEVQPDGMNCVNYLTLDYSCSNLCFETYQDLNKELPDCEFDSQRFGYLNLKKLQNAYHHLCSEFYESGVRSGLLSLPEDEWSEIFLDYNDPHDVRVRLLQSAFLPPSWSRDLHRDLGEDSDSDSYDDSDSDSEEDSDSDSDDIVDSDSEEDAGSDSYDDSDSESDDKFYSGSDEYYESKNVDPIPSDSALNYQGSIVGNVRDGADEDGGPSILGIVIPIVVALVVLALAGSWYVRRYKSALITKKLVKEGDYTRDASMTITESFTQSMSFASMRDPLTSDHVYDLWSDKELVGKRLDFTGIQDVKVLGSGTFGVVWLVTYNNAYYASKRLAQHVVDPTAFEKLVDEVRLVATLDHRNIIKCIGVAWTMKVDFQALFEYMSKGNLRNYLKRSMVPRHWTKEKLSIAIDIAEALVYVQSFESSVVHGDLQSRNVLLSEDMVAKVSDFGGARLMSENNAMVTQDIGTARWLAPELVTSESYDHTCDLYSFGAILTELDTHELPLHDVKDQEGTNLSDFALMHRVACRSIKPNVSENCPEAMRELVDKCLNFEPKERPTAVQIVFMLRKMMKDGSVLET